MTVLLDLYITHWTEPWEVGERAFQMLAMQRLVNWDEVKVTLVHDGSEAFPESYFKGYPFKVHQVCLPHGGIAKARNWCIENGTAEWIKWNDFDDTFANIYAMRDMMNVLPAENFDLLWFHMFWEEFSGKVYIKRDRECIFVHNKMIRRKFLLDNNIRFVEDLTWCEDSAFFADVEMLIDTKRIGLIKCDAPIYAYACRQGSLCNRPEIKFANLQSFFRRHAYVAEQFKNRGFRDQHNAMCVRVMGDSYYTLNLAPGITEDKSEHEARVWKWFDENKEAFHACRPEMFDEVLAAVNRECFDGGEIRKTDFLAWIDKHERGE